MRHYLYLLFISLSALLFSCNDNRVYEKNIDIESAWNKKDTLSFEFEISDANSKYNLFYTIRYSNSYPYYNLFTKYFLYDISGILIKYPQIPEDMYLFDPKTGEPYGKGLGDIFDQKVSFLKDFKFPVPGKYKIKVLQYMREDQALSGIQSFGIRVEKAENKAQ